MWWNRNLVFLYGLGQLLPCELAFKIELDEGLLNVIKGEKRKKAIKPIEL